MGNIIAITGLPGAGKTTLARKLGGAIIHTDDYMNEYSFKDLPTMLIKLLNETYSGNIIVEGVQVARMLRTGHREGIWTPDTVIWIADGDFDNKMAPTIERAFNDWENESQRLYYTIHRT